MILENTQCGNVIITHHVLERAEERTNMSAYQLVHNFTKSRILSSKEVRELITAKVIRCGKNSGITLEESKYYIFKEFLYVLAGNRIVTIYAVPTRLVRNEGRASDFTSRREQSKPQPYQRPKSNKRLFI